MMRLNLHVGPVRTQMNNTQRMNIYKMNTQKIPNSYVFSLYESDSKIINANETLSHVYSKDEN